jgi:hypothetical protein
MMTDVNSFCECKGEKMFLKDEIPECACENGYFLERFNKSCLSCAVHDSCIKCKNLSYCEECLGK